MITSVALSILCLQIVTLSGMARRFDTRNARGSNLRNWTFRLFGFIILPAGALRFGQEVFDVLFIQGQTMRGLWFDAVWFGVAVGLLWLGTLRTPKLSVEQTNDAYSSN
jgi:hypothetical protein